jgi:hypothetical protein
MITKPPQQQCINERPDNTKSQTTSPKTAINLHHHLSVAFLSLHHWGPIA